MEDSHAPDAPPDAAAATPCAPPVGSSAVAPSGDALPAADARRRASSAASVLPELRAALHSALDKLVRATAGLSQQLADMPGLPPAMRAIKTHVLDETDEFATAAYFISLRLQAMVPLPPTPPPSRQPLLPTSTSTSTSNGSASDGDGSGTGAPAGDGVHSSAGGGVGGGVGGGAGAVAAPTELQAAASSVQILAAATEVLSRRLRWALTLHQHGDIDTSVLEAYSVEANAPASLWATLRGAVRSVGRKVLRHKRRRVIPLAAEQRAFRDIQSMKMLPGLPPPPGSSTFRTDLALRDAMRARSTCGTMASVVSGATAVCSGAFVAAVEDNSPTGLTSEFIAKLSAVREQCRSARMTTALEVHTALELCWELLQAYMAFTDLRQCCICREIVTPRDQLVSSQSGPAECATKHMFHEACLPLEYALKNGCPVCRRPIHGLQCVQLEPLFRLRPDALGSSPRRP